MMVRWYEVARLCEVGAMMVRWYEVARWCEVGAMGVRWWRDAQLWRGQRLTGGRHHLDVGRAKRGHVGRDRRQRQ